MSFADGHAYEQSRSSCQFFSICVVVCYLNGTSLDSPTCTCDVVRLPARPSKRFVLMVTMIMTLQAAGRTSDAALLHTVYDEELGHCCYQQRN